MSYWVYLMYLNKNNPHYPEGVWEPLTVRRHYGEGGTYAFSTESQFGGREYGSTKAELNVTWNYSKFYYAYLDKEEGLKWLDGKKAKEVIPRLKEAVHILGTKRSFDYWDSTNGNAGFALAILLDWAQQHPNGVFEVH